MLTHTRQAEVSDHVNTYKTAQPSDVSFSANIDSCVMVSTVLYFLVCPTHWSVPGKKCTVYNINSSTIKHQVLLITCSSFNTSGWILIVMKLALSLSQAKHQSQASSTSTLFIEWLLLGEGEWLCECCGLFSISIEKCCLQTALPCMIQIRNMCSSLIPSAEQWKERGGREEREENIPPKIFSHKDEKGERSTSLSNHDRGLTYSAGVAGVLWKEVFAYW